MGTNTDDNNHDVVVNHKSCDTPTTYTRVYDLLARAYPERAGEAMEILIEQCLITAGEFADALVPDAATLAVVDTLSQKRRKPWPTFCSHMQAIVRGQRERIRLDEETDPPRYQYTRLVGPCPPGMPGHEDVRRWNDGLLEWRREGSQYFIARRRETWPRLFARAVELGLWEGEA